MGEDSFAHLPPEIITDILSRLSVRCVALSKCVCKPWLDLLESDDFVNSYHSKSGAALAVSLGETIDDSNPIMVFESESIDLITKIDFPRNATVMGSADDLILLGDSEDYNALYVCNPITREFIELHFRDGFRKDGSAFGFGASKGTRQYKVLRLEPGSDYCHVYTLGTGRWRRVEAPTASVAMLYDSAFVNGNLYWCVSDSKDLKGEPWICCFDVETERFSTISLPPVRGGGCSSLFVVVALRGCLYGYDDEIALWLLEERGAEIFWRKEYVFDYNVYFCPVQFFKNGDILLSFDGRYSFKTKTYQEITSLGALDFGFNKTVAFHS